jgi:citrate lyase beta subunit
MRSRSLLFVPGDSERKFVRGANAGADILILDLENSVAPAKKPEAHVANLPRQALPPSKRASPIWTTRRSRIVPKG